MKWKEDLTALGMIGVGYGILMVLGITCPIKFVTGMSCPGCGMTRAWLSLLRLDLGAAWVYHPLFWILPVCVVLFLIRHKLPRGVVRGGAAVICALFVGVYLARLWMGGGDVVVWDPAQGLLPRLWRFIQGK